VSIVTVWIAYAVVALTLMLLSERMRRTGWATHGAVFAFFASWMIAATTLVFGENWREAVPTALISATLFVLWMAWRSRKRRISA
jgi:hypothetical protein